MKKLNKKGSFGWVMISALILIFGTALVFMCTSQVIDKLYMKFNGTFNDTGIQTVFTQIHTYYLAFPLVLIFGAVLWIIVEATKQEPGSGYY